MNLFRYHMRAKIVADVDIAHSYAVQFFDDDTQQITPRSHLFTFPESMMLRVRMNDRVLAPFEKVCTICFSNLACLLCCVNVKLV